MIDILIKIEKTETININLKSSKPVVHVCNPSYLGSGNGEGCSSRPAQAKS
jgi:hypothetical protein